MLLLPEEYYGIFFFCFVLALQSMQLYFYLVCAHARFERDISLLL